MIVPVFKIQIVSVATGLVAESFGNGPLERDLVAGVIKALDGKPIGFLQSRATVEAAVADAIRECCDALKRETRAIVHPAMVDAVKVQEGKRASDS